MVDYSLISDIELRNKCEELELGAFFVEMVIKSEKLFAILAERDNVTNTFGKWFIGNINVARESFDGIEEKEIVIYCLGIANQLLLSDLRRV